MHTPRHVKLNASLIVDANMVRSIYLTGTPEKLTIEFNDGASLHDPAPGVSLATLLKRLNGGREQQ